MGNRLSCTKRDPGGGSARVIFPGGQARWLGTPVSAAELMIDAPGHFVASAAAVQVGSRFAPLAADEEVESGGVYVMVPITRSSLVVTPADVAELRTASGGGSKAPVESEGGLGMVEGMEEMERRYRINRCRSRKPELETIAEESVHRRRSRHAKKSILQLL